MGVAKPVWAQPCEGEADMTMFMSTISGKIDAKGRVSVPSVFRSAISAQNGAVQSGAPQGIFVYPSFTENAIEGGGHTLMNDIGAMVERLNLFAEERDALAASLFADSHHLNFDADGRGFPSGTHCWRMPVSKKSCALSAWAANSRFGIRKVLPISDRNPAPWRLNSAVCCNRSVMPRRAARTGHNNEQWG